MPKEIATATVEGTRKREEPPKRWMMMKRI
jgi:hypothetical protein